MTPSRRRADAHIHLFRAGFIEGTRDELTWYDELRCAAGVTAALVVGYEDAPRFAGNNAHILALSQQYDWVRPTAYIDVSAPPSAENLRGMRESGFVGWSVYLPETGPSLSAWSPEQLAALSGGILSVNASPAALSSAADVLGAITDTRVLVSHLGLPGPAAHDALSPLLSLAPFEHVTVKLSGLYAIDPPYPHHHAQRAVEVVLDAFGAGRLAWGSDFSPVTSAVAPADVMAVPEWIVSRLSPSEAEAILGGTLHRHLAHVDSIGGTDA